MHNRIFLRKCARWSYVRLESLRREIHEGLNVVETWNSANDFILYGKGGEFASNKREDQEVGMLALHLLQISLVYINTLIVKEFAFCDWPEVPVAQG
jgi:TnpA family transposase